MNSMKTRMLVPLLVVLAVGLWSCTNDSTAPLPSEGAISGTIKDAGSGLALKGVSISIGGANGDVGTVVSDDQGAFNVKFSMDSVATITLRLSRDRYRDTSIAIQMFAGSSTTLSVSMVSVQAVSGTSGGTPQTIAFLNAVPAELSVYGVGGKETSVLTWQVRDSLGNPMDGLNPATISFSMLSPLGGGEYISPSSITTDASGSAAVTLNSGTKAGVVQVLATVATATRTIESSPVRIVIHGGFPDQAHFTISTPAFNFPALGIAGARHQISVLVGDKYSNPASPTAVYFRSSAGVIQGTISGAITTLDGQGTVDLISGNPEPIGPPYRAEAFGDGYHYVVARTLGQNGVVVQDSLYLLWSGGAMISRISPTTFNIPNAGSQAIVFNVEDILHHPLAEATAINVTATIPPPPVDGVQQNKVFLLFGDQGRVILPDVVFPGPGTTQFSMTVQDGSWGILDSAGTPVTITITVTGPNTVSPVTSTITGVVH